MAGHFALTMGTVTYICWDTRFYNEMSMKIVEVGSEFLLCMVSIIQMQYTNTAYSADTLLEIENLGHIFFAALLILNISYVIWIVITGFKSKKRHKAWLKRKEEHEKKLKEDANKSPDTSAPPKLVHLSRSRAENINITILGLPAIEEKQRESSSSDEGV